MHTKTSNAAISTPNGASKPLKPARTRCSSATTNTPSWQVDDEHAPSVPALLTRFELTPANADIVDVTLDLIDRNPTAIDEVIVDRHYHYKSVDRWKRQLIARGIEQHLDLRDNEHGFTESNRMRWAAGRPHCPATPDAYGTIKAPALGASGNDWVNFHKKIGERQTYEMRPHTQMDPTNDTERLGCPAEAGKVGCPLWDRTNGAPLNADTPNEQRAATVQTAVLAGLPIVENPPSVHDGEPLPACCTQRTVKVTVPESQLKLRQRHRWGSEPWRERRGQRSRVEGQFGNKKNPSVENLRRGQNQKFGLVWAHIVMAMVNASYNTRILQNWHDRNPNIELDHHPLFTKQAADPEFIVVSPANTNSSSHCANNKQQPDHAPTAATPGSYTPRRLPSPATDREITAMVRSVPQPRADCGTDVMLDVAGWCCSGCHTTNCECSGTSPLFDTSKITVNQRKEEHVDSQRRSNEACRKAVGRVAVALGSGRGSGSGHVGSRHFAGNSGVVGGGVVCWGRTDPYS